MNARREGPLHRAGQWCLKLLWGAGGGAALFLLLCAAGALSPAEMAAASPAEAGAETGTVAVFAREEPAPFRAAALSADDLDQAEAAAAGLDGVVVTMKAPDGALAWVSALPQAADCGASFPLPARNEALRAMNETEGLYTVARVSCLRDEKLVRAFPFLALEGPGGAPWRDEDGLGWLDPTDQGVQTYCIGLCRELADLGFDEILLTDCRYPQDSADCRGPRDRTAALETFCRRLQGALADRPVVLSAEGAEKDGALDPDSGQTPALLASFSGRVWGEGSEAGALAAFRPARLPGE